MNSTLHPTLHDPQRPSIDLREERDIEDLLVWAFRDQAVEAEIFRTLVGWSGRPGAASNADLIGRIMQLGTIVETSRGGGETGKCNAPTDAITIFEAVCAEEPETIGLLAHYAKAGSAPEWPDMVPRRLVPYRNAAGRALSDPGDSKNGIGRHSPLKLDHGPDLVEHDRETYARWHAGLCNVARRLGDSLERFRVAGPGRWGPGPV